MLKEIINQYKIVFNEDGTVKNCGRENCKKLIELMNKVFSEEIFGNKDTGFMNVDNINKTIKEIQQLPSDKIINQYNIVFDNEGKIKPCGRENCKKLIELMNNEYSNINFGDLKTGFMKVETIKMFIKKTA